jgi:hypothetical protein
MRKIRISLALPALAAAVVVPAVAGTGPGAQVAYAATARSAVTPADSYLPIERDTFCNRSNACGDVTLWLDTSTGYLHAELNGDDLNGGHPAIPGSEVTLQTSGYEDFRNVPYTWRAWVPGSGADDWLANTRDVFYTAPGANWWWRACGYIGSAHICTMNWKITYAAGLGWKEVPYPPGD